MAKSDLNPTRKELIDLFANIDSKIVSLHRCSAEDFLALNSYLKDYYNKTKIISENATCIYEITAGKNSSEFIHKLNTLKDRLAKCQNSSNLLVDQTISRLERIFSRINMVALLLKNLNQDLMTLKFLTSNLELTSHYDGSIIDVRKKLAAMEELIKTLRQLFPEHEQNIDAFRKDIKDIIERLRRNQEHSRTSLSSIMEEIESSITLISLKNEESKMLLPELTQKTESTSKSIADIITHLQYHDIIRQKIEHIQKSHVLIIEDLEQIKETDEEKEAREYRQYEQVCDITGLQAAQLILVNKEYQNAVEIITNSFQDIASDLNSLSNISQKFSQYKKSSNNTLFYEIQKKLENGHQKMTDFNHSNQEIEKEFQKNKEVLKMVSAMYEKIEENLLKLEGVIDKPEQNQANERGASNSKIQNQVAPLVQEIFEKNQNIKNLFFRCINLYGGIDIQTSSMFYDPNLDSEQSNVFHELTSTLEALNKSNDMLQAFLMQNNKLSNEVLGEIQGTIKRIRYYDFFDKVISEIIEKLNAINFGLRQMSSKEKVSNKKENLERIKKLYTTDSEHIVHKHVESNDENSLFLDNIELFNQDTEEEDENLELF